MALGVGELASVGAEYTPIRWLTESLMLLLLSW
jgi:hypothetical protein